MTFAVDIVGTTRAERRAVDSFIEVIGFVDENGSVVDEVPDRFQSRYLWVHGPSGEENISEGTLADCGITRFTIKDAVTFGFSTAEYLDLIEWERQSDVYIQNEDELTALFDRAIRNNILQP